MSSPSRLELTREKDSRGDTHRTHAMSGVGGGAGGSHEDTIEALLAEFPALVRVEDGRVKCSLTGHVMSARPEAVKPYVKGKKFAAALAKEKDLQGLKQFEPHIVRSEYVPGKLFCRITGRYVQAKEAAVVQHSTGKRFERGVEMLTGGKGGKLMTERPPEELEAERKLAEEKQKAAVEAKNNKSAATKRREKGQKRKDGDKEEDDTPAPVDPRAAAERERLRVNGGFSKEMGCWVPPAHIIDSDEDDDVENSEDEEQSSDEEDADEYEEEDSSEDDDSEDEEDDILCPTVRMPNFAKIMAKVKQSGKKAVVIAPTLQQRRPKQLNGTVPMNTKARPEASRDDGFDWNADAKSASTSRQRGATRQREIDFAGAGTKRAAETPLKKGKKVNQSKPAKRGRKQIA